MLLHEHDREVLAGRFLAFVEVGLAAAELRSLGVVGQAHAHAGLHVLLAVLGLLGRQDVAAGLLVGEELLLEVASRGIVADKGVLLDERAELLLAPDGQVDLHDVPPYVRPPCRRGKGAGDRLRLLSCGSVERPAGFAVHLPHELLHLAVVQAPCLAGLHAGGHLACGDSGKGKLCDIKDILEYVDHYFQRSDLLKGKHVLITAGPTQEALDPVRYLTNHSSGKMGYALAQAALDMGASVTLISGPVQLNAPKGAKLIPVKTAVEMFDAVVSCYEQADFIIKAAAVGDYRPLHVSEQKIKKSGDSLHIKFVKNPDILAYIGKHKRNDQILCGFAMETQNLLENARGKLENKNCDMIVANNLHTEGAGFQSDTNIATILDRFQNTACPKMSKYELGMTILKHMLQLYTQGEK